MSQRTDSAQAIWGDRPRPDLLDVFVPRNAMTDPVPVMRFQFDPEGLRMSERDWSPRKFDLVRDDDETGISGTGVVATGCVWPDGVAIMRWRPGPVGASSTAVYASLADVERIHGHGGKTRVVLEES